MNPLKQLEKQYVDDKPERVKIIQQDEILDLTILLNTSDDVNDFLNKL